jgi:AGCS family alanine or glycine:cation symporter
MEVIDTIIGAIKQLNGFVWGTPMLVLILGTGFFLMLGLRLMPILKLPYGFMMLWQGRKGKGEGDISSFNALMTALSATVGTGNIAGVATAIFSGGPGALFWMWCTALVGMATKYSEAVCAVRFRETDENGLHVGGPMYYIKNGLGNSWAWLGGTFAVFGSVAGFGIGNTVQANSVADAMESAFGVNHYITGLVIMIAVALVLIGGITRIAEVAGKLVPFMAIIYLGAGLSIILLHISDLPSAFHLIITQAFTPTAAEGGFAGATVWLAIRWGVARGIFSNEAGLGSAPIAHAAAKTDDPVRQGTIAMLGTFLDTIIICSITGLVIILSGEWGSGETAAALSTRAFETMLPGAGHYIVSVGLVLFAFTTLLGWSYYGERCVQYLFGAKSIIPFRILWVFAIPVGAIAQLNLVWLVADTLNALMALPNLVALIMLSPVVFSLTRDYFRKGEATSNA